MGWQHPGRNDFPPSRCCISEQSRSGGRPESASKVPSTGTQFLAVLVDGIPTPRGWHSLAVQGKSALHSSVGGMDSVGKHRQGEQHTEPGAPGRAAVLAVLARWLQPIWLLRHSAARRPSGEPKTKVSEPSASLLQPSLPACEWSELFHLDPCDSTKAFMPQLPVELAWDAAGLSQGRASLSHGILAGL